MKSMYCPKCEKLVEAEVIAAEIPLTVRKTDVITRQLQATCPFCGDSIADEQLSRYNLDSAFDAYRRSQGLLSGQNINDIYTGYGLTQQAFAKLLGLGGATLSRYEHGAVQTKQIDGTIRAARNPKYMLSLLAERGNTIDSELAEIARSRAEEMLAASNESACTQKSEGSNFQVKLMDSDPSEYNGFRRLDWARASQMAVYLAGHCCQLGRTKLNKAFFYADYRCFAETSRSISGLVYARATFGPVVDNFDMFFGELVSKGVLREEPVADSSSDATYYAPNLNFNPDLFTAEELAALQKTAAFVDSFSSASALSEYSHKEKLWMEHANGEKLTYLEAFDLNPHELLD